MRKASIGVWAMGDMLAGRYRSFSGRNTRTGRFAKRMEGLREHHQEVEEAKRELGDGSKDEKRQAGGHQE